MNFNEIPDVPKDLIFKRFTNTELVQLGHVCHQWEALQENQYRAKNTLVLLVGGSALDAWTESCFNEFQYHNLVAELDAVVPMDTVPQSPQYLAKWFGLNVRVFSIQFAQYLVRKYTNITTLIIVSSVEEHDLTPELFHLFTGWSANLQTVKLFIQTNWDSPQPPLNVNIILGKLNELPSLTHLTFDFAKHNFRVPNDTSVHMPILARLTEFYFSCFVMTQSMLDSIARYALANEGLSRIGLCLYIIECGTHRRIFEHNTVTAKFSHLLLLRGGLQHMPTVSRYFINLTHFRVNLFLTEGKSYHQTMTQLASLTQLTNLTINLYSFDGIILKREYEMEAAGELVLPHLPSVRVLKLEITSHQHSTLTNMHLGRIFTNVRYIDLYFEEVECRPCFPFVRFYSYFDLEDIHDCLSATLSGLQSFRHLIRCKIGFRNAGQNGIMARVRDIIHNDEYRIELVN